MRFRAAIYFIVASGHVKQLVHKARVGILYFGRGASSNPRTRAIPCETTVLNDMLSRRGLSRFEVSVATLCKVGAAKVVAKVIGNV